MKIPVSILASLISANAMASFSCELIEAPGNFLEYDLASRKVDLVWHMVSHDGSTRIWRERLVGENHASGYPYKFSACEYSQYPLGSGAVRLEYSCGNFTQGRLEATDTGQFVAKTWINGGFTERRI